MKILFVVNNLSVTEPMGIMQLSSILKKNNHQTYLAVISKNNVIKSIEGIKPDIIAYSAMSVDICNILKLNETIKSRFDIFTIIGGPHPTFVSSIINEKNIDAVCVGEGETAIVELLSKLQNNHLTGQINNIITKESQELKLNPLISNLDELPFIDRKILYDYNEFANMPIKGISTSRGCPFTCTYCFNKKFADLYKNNGQYIRRHSVEYVIEETLKLKSEYRLDFVRIADDCFFLKTDEWLEEFAKKWKSKIGLKYYCLLRPEIINAENSRLLKYSGCHSVHLAVEAGNDIVRSEIMDRKLSKERIIKSFELLRNNGINTFAPGILGIPYTDLSYDLETVELLSKCRPNIAGFGIFMPYPGSALGEYCEKNDLINRANSNEWFGTGDTSVLKCFDESRLLQLRNLRHLGIFAVKYPILQKIIFKFFINQRLSTLYSILNLVYSSYLGKKYFVKVKIRLGDIFYFIRTILKYMLTDTGKYSKNKSALKVSSISNTARQVKFDELRRTINLY